MVVMPDNRLLLVNDDVKTTASVFVDVGGGSLSLGGAFNPIFGSQCR